MPDRERIPFEELFDSGLTAEDAVRVVEAVQENGYRILPVTMCLPAEDDSPPVYRLYETLLQLDSVDDFVKSRVRWVQKIQAELDRSDNEFEPSGVAAMRARTDEITRAVESEEKIATVGVADTVTELRRLRRTGHFRSQDPDPGILGEDGPEEITDQIVEMTIKMLDEGQKTIFWPRYIELHTGARARDEIAPMGWREAAAEVGRTAWEGAKGAIGGAVTGALSGARVGGLPGAKIGAGIGAATGFVGGATANTLKELEDNVKEGAKKKN